MKLIIFDDEVCVVITMKEEFLLWKRTPYHDVVEDLLHAPKSYINF